MGYIEVHWDVITKDIVKQFDADGDGEITLKDMRSIAKSVVHVIAFSGPAMGGFSAGIYFGLTL